jgi:hypothetical protein
VACVAVKSNCISASYEVIQERGPRVEPPEGDRAMLTILLVAAVALAVGAPLAARTDGR